MRKRRPSSDELTAHHEAGHALVGHHVGFDSDGITIVGQKGLGGYILSHKRQAIPGVVDFDIKKGERPDEGPLPDRLIYLHAGVVAERRLCAQRGVSSKPVHLGNDIRVARNSVRHLLRDEQIKLLESAEKHAMELLSDPQNWQIVESIAAELLKFGGIDGPSLLALLAS